MRQYLEVIRPFFDSDFDGRNKFPVTIEECPYERETYEDAALSVRYIPLVGAGQQGQGPLADQRRRRSPSPSSQASSSPSYSGVEQNVDVAFLVELKPALRVF